MSDMIKKDSQNIDVTQQPKQYSEEELKKLKMFIETVKNDETRSALACWGNHHDFTKGY